MWDEPLDPPSSLSRWALGPGGWCVWTLSLGSLAPGSFAQREVLEGAWRDEEGSAGGSLWVPSPHDARNGHVLPMKPTASASQLPPPESCRSHWIPAVVP